MQVVMLALTAAIVAITEIYGWRRRRARRHEPLQTFNRGKGKIDVPAPLA